MTPTVLDQNWLNFMISERSHEIYTTVAKVLDKYGQVGAFAALGLIFVVLLVQKRFDRAVFVAASTVLNAAAIEILKHLIKRDRPTEQLVTANGYSFPSGHAAMTACLAFVLIALTRNALVAILGIAYTAVMMASRTYLGVHWVTDVLAGALIALVAVLLASLIARAFKREDEFEDFADGEPALPTGRGRRAA